MKIKTLIILLALMLIPSWIQADNLILKEKDLKFIYSLFENNKYDMALTQIDQFFSQYPQATELDDLRYVKVECLFLTGSYTSCIETARQILTAHPQFPYQAEINYRVALAYFHLKDPSNSIRLMKDFHKRYPTHALSQDLNYWLGVSLYQQHDYTGSREYLEKYLKKPDSEYAAYASFSLGKIHQMQNNPVGALKHIEPLTTASYQNHPVYPQAQALVPELYYQSGEYTKTIDFVRKQSSKVNHYDHLLYLKGISHLALKQYPACIEVFQGILKQYPKTAHRRDIYINTLQCHFLSGNYSSGSALASQILATEKAMPGDFYYWYLLNAVENGESAPVRTHMASLKKSDPSRADEIISRQADYAFRKKQYQQTITILEANPISQPKLKSSSQKQLGDAYYHLKQYEKARQAYDSMISSGQDQKLNLEALFLSAISEYQLKNYRKSIEKFNRILNQSPYPNDYYEASVIYAQKNLIETGDYQGMEKLVNSLKARPSKKEHLFYFHYYQGYAAYMMNRYQAGIDHLNRALPQATTIQEKSMVGMMIGDAYFNLKNFQQAIAFYQQSDRSGMTAEEKSKTLFQTGMAYLKLKQYDSAALQFKGIYLDHPAGSQADDAYYYHGRCLFLQEKYQECLDLLKAFHTRFPKSDYQNSVTFQIADAYYNLKDFDQSFIYYRDALNTAVTPEIMDQASKGIEWSLQQSSDSRQSISRIDELLKENPSPRLQTGLMLIKIRLIRKSGQVEKTIDEYEALLKQHPGQVELVLPDYLQVLLESGHEEQAEALLNTHLASVKNGAQADFMRLKLAELEFQGERFEAALKNLDSIQPNSTQAAPAMLLKGKIYAASQRPESADSIFVLLQNRQPQSYYARSAQLEQGKLYLFQKQYEQAEQVFQEIIAGSTGEEAAAAQYYIGEVKYEQQDYNLAAAQYLKVQYIYEKFSNWAEKAQWKAALCDIHQNHLTEAKEKLNKLRKTSADTAMQRMADEELKRIE
ncbi:MAG: tetratricopeptide repeat protein [Candidatus Delongbacteria bacterium]|nr:tetratricopeptide repeat protein [Candidatus Delongbacteria bacterium]